MKFLAFFSLLFATVWAQNNTCRQREEYVAAIQQFGFLFLNPGLLINGNASAPYADDVIGRVDVTTTFPGQELNVEYFFGLFLEVSKQNTTQLIGAPVNATLQELLVEPPLTYASFVVDFVFNTLGTIVPLQIDLLFRFNSDLLITSYDATLRRLPQLLKLMKPKLAEQIRKELNGTGMDDTQVITQRAAIDICNIEQQFCLGELNQYDSFDSCMSFLTAIPFGDAWEGGLNTTWCRYIHKNMISHRPEIHCPHVGPSGGGMCIDRDYFDIVNNPPYVESLVDTDATCIPAAPVPTKPAPHSTAPHSTAPHSTAHPSKPTKPTGPDHGKGDDHGNGDHDNGDHGNGDHGKGDEL